MDVVKGEEGITREYQWNAAKLLFQPFDNLGINIVSVADDKTIKFIEEKTFCYSFIGPPERESMETMQGK